MWEIISVVLCSFFIFIYYVTTKKYSYWKDKNVSYLKPVPILGNYGDYILLKKTLGVVTQNICKQYPNEPYVGAFFGTEPTLIIQDPDLLKLVLVKDFYYFNGREVSDYTEREPVTKSVFFTSGDKWKVIRHHLTPLYSTAKLKNMFPLIDKCTYDFSAMLEYETQQASILDTYRLMGRYSMDCVGSIAFGIETNVMQKNYKENPFANLGEVIFGKSDIRGYKNVARSIWPRLFYGLGFQAYPPELKDLMLSIVTRVFEQRQYKPTSRDDFVDFILAMKQSEYLTVDSMNSVKTGIPEQISLKVDNEVLAGLCAAFFGGAFETSANTLTMTALELAKNPRVQAKLQKEVDAYLKKHDNKIGYDCGTELPYLAACIDETLRLYPVFTIITREVMEDYTLPTGLHLEKGMRLHIPLYHMHRNPKNFPNPEEYRPERFMPEERDSIKPFTYMPYGEGPRICIGMRLSKIQVYAAIITLVKDYNISLPDAKVPTVEFDPRWIVSHTMNDIHLKYERRDIIC